LVVAVLVTLVGSDGSVAPGVPAVIEYEPRRDVLNTWSGETTTVSSAVFDLTR
jgi:hypothetical protein